MINAAAIVYLGVSVASLTVQAVALIKVAREPAAVPLARAGLIRTACCRVVAATIYVSLGIIAIMGALNTGALALIALVIVQVVWQVNAMLDARLAKALARGDHK